MIRSEPTLANLLADTRAARELLSSQRYRAARRLLIAVRARGEALGIRSVSLLCNLGEAAAELGESEAAFDLVSEAAILDPLDPEVQTAFNRVCGGLRAMLAGKVLGAAGDEATARIYAKLSRAGETDVPCHLAMARHIHATGHTTEALKLVDSVCLLSPTSLGAWRLKRELARATGDTALLATCEESLASLAEPLPLKGPTLS